MNPLTIWQSAHIFYHDDPGLLLRMGVAPLFRQTAPLVERQFFVRHWVRGPHLRLHFLTDPATYHTQLSPLIDAHLGAVLAAHPSTTVLDADMLRPLYEHLAAEEEEEGPLFPLAANNSIEHTTYHRRLNILQDVQVAALVEDFLSDTTDLAFMQLDAIHAGTSRLSLGFDLMVALAHACSGTITDGFLSYRSHAEAFLENWPGAASTRARFDASYARHAPTLRARLRQVVAAVDARDPALAFIGDWVRVLLQHRARLREVVYARTPGAMPQGRTTLAPAQVAAIQERIGRSRFHAVLQADDTGRAALWNHPGFQIYRMLLNLQYLHLSRLGIKPIERYQLCHLVANAVEDEFAIAAPDLLAAQLQQLPTAAGGPR